MTQRYISSRSLLDFRARMACAPMLSTFGGGSARGFNPGAAGGGPPLDWGDYTAAGGSNVPSHNFAPSAGSSWGYTDTVADTMVWKGDTDWVLYGVGGGGLNQGSMNARVRIYDLGTSIGSANTKVYDESGFTYATSTFYSYNFGDGGNGDGGELPVLLSSNYYQVQTTYYNVSGPLTIQCGTKVTSQLTAQGVGVTPNNFDTVFDGFSSNGTSTTSGQQFWIAAAATTEFA